MKRILQVLAFCFPAFLYAQQYQQYTQYMVNPYAINPAVGGTENYADVKVGYRTQWVNFGRDNSGPKTYYISGHTTLGKQFRQYHHKGEHGYWHGIGGYLYKDAAGPISFTSFNLNYAFNMPINKHTRFSFGIFGGFKQMKVDKSWWNFLDKPGYDQDNYLASNDFTKVMPDLSVGGWWYSTDYYIGASMFQLLHNKVSQDGWTAAYSQGSGNLVGHYFVTGGFRMPMSEVVDLVPSFAMKGVVNTPLSVDLNLKLQYQDLFFGGINWRVQDSFAAIAGVVLMKRLEVSYSYDFTTTKDIRTHSSGTHEVIVGLRLPHGKNIDCPSKFW